MAARVWRDVRFFFSFLFCFERAGYGHGMKMAMSTVRIHMQVMAAAYSALSFRIRRAMASGPGRPYVL